MMCKGKNMLTSNLEVLKSCDAQLSEQLSLKPPTFLTFEWITTKTGHLTLKLISANGKPFFLHSAYSPINEGKQFAHSHVQKSEYPQTSSLWIWSRLSC